MNIGTNYFNNQILPYLPIQFTRGLGYSPASGPPEGGGNFTSYNPHIYSSTFFGYDVKGAMIPSIFQFPVQTQMPVVVIPTQIPK